MRRLDIDRAKGLAIILVVFGHIVARQDPSHVTWYQPLRRGVYGFHMPFFFYLSGMVSSLAGHVEVAPGAWLALLRSRGRRLLVPFLLMGLLIIIGKLAAAHIMHVDNVPRNVVSGVVDLIWSPGRSPAYSLWYLAVLFVLGVTTPVAVWLVGGQLWPVVLGYVALEWATPPWHLYLADLCRYGLFYALGVWAGAYNARWTAWIDRWHLPLLGAFVTGFVLVALFGHNWPFDLRLFALGLISMPAVHSLVRRPWLSSDRILVTMGEYSLMIYLFNTIFIGFTKGLLLHVTSWNGDHFPIFLAAMMTAGMFGPIMLKRTVLRAIPPLDRMTG